MKYLRQAFSLLTILPLGSDEAPQPGDSGRAAVWYPLVGLVIGCLTAGADGCSRASFRPWQRLRSHWHSG